MYACSEMCAFEKMKVVCFPYIHIHMHENVWCILVFGDFPHYIPYQLVVCCPPFPAVINHYEQFINHF